MFLEDLSNGGNRRSWWLQSDRIYKLGRNPDQDICLQESSVSRNHATLTYRDGNWFLQDCNSRFGTYVNDRPISQQHRLQPGDRPGNRDFNMALERLEQIQKVILEQLDIF